MIGACTKDKVRAPFVGNYDCTVTYTYQDINGNYSSYTEQSTMEVIEDADSLEVFGGRVHKEEVNYGDSYFFGYSWNHMTFRFEEDSIYVSTYAGGLGGGSSSYWRGKRMD